MKTDMPGKKFGRLLCIEYSHTEKRGLCWKCQCDCGSIVVVLGSSLRSGNTKSCGCLGKEITMRRSYKHGHCGRTNTTRIHRIWARMKQRCNDPNSSDRYKYHLRGIRVCEEWNNSFESFLKWALENGYQDTLTIERINNDGNYSPANCKWITPAKQARNTRHNHVITINGVARTLAEWSEISGIDAPLLRYRIRQGWPMEKLFKTPYKKGISDEYYVKRNVSQELQRA